MPTISRRMSEQQKPNRKGWKHWVMVVGRWGVLALAVWYFAVKLSIRDRAWVILDHQTNRPVQVSLRHSVGENASTFPLEYPHLDVPAADVVNEPDQKTVLRRENGQLVNVQLLGLDLVGDLNHTAKVRRLLVADSPTAPAVWIGPDEAANYEVKIPHPRDQIGLESMVRGANGWLLWASILVFPITFIVTSYRWNELLKALDIHLKQSRTFVLTMVGCFYNTFLPGSTGGDLAKAYYASKQTPHRARAVMSVVVDRAIGLLALFVVGGITAAFQWEIPACKKVALGSAFVWVCVLIGLLIFYNPTLHRRSGLDFLLRKLPAQKHVHAAVEAMHLYGRRPGLALWALLASLPVHATVIISATLAGMAFGLPLKWPYYWAAVPVIVLAGAVPISPQGAGVMEAFAVLLTRRQGVTVSQAFALAMSIRVVQILWNFSGVFFVLRGGFHAPTDTEKKELEEDEQLSQVG